MFLLVITTLMIGVIGIYAQVMSLQAARIASHMSGLGSTMLQWHTAAISMAASMIHITGNPPTTGCSLTATPPWATGMATCTATPLYHSPPNPGTITNAAASPVLSLIPNYTTNTDECVHLAPRCTATNGTSPYDCNACTTAYDTKDYQFFSVFYRDATLNQNFVVTFVPAPIPSAANPAPGNISLPDNVNATGHMLGISASQLSQQLAHAGIDPLTYGHFDYSLTPKKLVAAGNIYSLPTGLNSLCNPSATCQATGSVAIISTPDGF